MDQIERYIKSKHKEKKFLMRIDGSTKQSTSHENVNLFQSSNDCRIALLSITACNTGLTLTKANVVVFAQLYFTPAIHLQCEDRVHRIGQSSHCQAIYLIGKNTLDEDIFEKLNNKQKVVTETLDKEIKDIKVDLDEKFEVDKNKNNCN